MDSCGDHYGSKCNFSCSVGYRLNGSSTVTCNAPGNSPPGVWDSPIPVCHGTFHGTILMSRFSSLFQYGSNTRLTTI